MQKTTKQKIKHHSLAILATSTLCALTLKFGIAMASDVIILVQGARTATIGTDYIDYGSVQSSFQDQTIQGVRLGTDGIIVDDLVSGSASWTVSFNATNFTGVTNGQTIPYTNIAIKGDTDGVIDVIAGNPSTDGITTFTNYTNLTGNGTYSNDITLISADNRERIGKYQVVPELRLLIPGGISLDTYNDTFTFTFLVS